MTDSDAPQQSASASRRRASIAGIADMFGASRASGSGSPPSSLAGPISHAAAQAQQRRLSITTLGLSTSAGAGTPATPFSALRSRQQSISSAGSGSVSVDESPFEDGEASPPAAAGGGGGLGRRVSFGARAMRDMRSSSGGGSAGGSGGGGINANEGFNFAENMRARAERGSISLVPGSVPAAPAAGAAHGRAKSVAVMEPPVREMPAHPRKPDQFQERILKGDFYMD